MNNILIAIDHGNKNTKVLGKDGINKCFSTGYVESEFEPITKENLLYYNDKYYSIGTNRFPATFDKSADNRFFILTLAAIAHNLKVNSINEGNVILSIGLPISSYGTLKGKFKQYFIRQNIRFAYEGITFKISIVDCEVYPQGYSAILSSANEYKQIDAVCIDIGGYTTDIFEIEKGLKLNIATARSYNNGIIKLFKDIQQELLKQNIMINENQIENVIRKNAPLFFNEDIINIINQKAEQYTNNLLGEINESFEIKVNPIIFIGGGSCLLRKYIESSSKVGYTEFLDEYSNCRGYEILTKKAMRIKGE